MKENVQNVIKLLNKTKIVYIKQIIKMLYVEIVLILKNMKYLTVK